MKRVSPEKLQRELKAKMLDGEYTIDELYRIYDSMMRIDFDLQYQTMTPKTFSNKLTEWSNAAGSWLIKKGVGKSALYHKRCCKRLKISRQESGDNNSPLLAAMSSTIKKPSGFIFNSRHRFITAIVSLWCA